LHGSNHVSDILAPVCSRCNGELELIGYEEPPVRPEKGDARVGRCRECNELSWWHVPFAGNPPKKARARAW